MNTTTQRGRDLQQRLGLSGRPLASVCSALHRAAVRYIRIQEELCSGPRWSWGGARWEWSQEWQDRIEKADERCEKRIRQLVAELGEGYGVEFSGDPRGSCVFVSCPDGRTGGDWGQRGVPVVVCDID